MAEDNKNELSRRRHSVLTYINLNFCAKTMHQPPTPTAGLHARVRVFSNACYLIDQPTRDTVGIVLYVKSMQMFGKISKDVDG